MDNDKFKEVKKILNLKVKIDLDSKIKELKKIYKPYLKGFKYVVDSNTFLEIKNKYIRYVGFDNKINYGGFLLKAEKKGNIIYIYLINKDKKVWFINTNNFYIFINNILTKNEKTREQFEQFLLENEK